MTNMGPLYRAILRIAPEPGEEGKGRAIGSVYLSLPELLCVSISAARMIARAYM